MTRRVVNTEEKEEGDNRIVETNQRVVTKKGGVGGTEDNLK